MNPAKQGANTTSGGPLIGIRQTWRSDFVSYLAALCLYLHSSMRFSTVAWMARRPKSRNLLICFGQLSSTWPAAAAASTIPNAGPYTQPHKVRRKGGRSKMTKHTVKCPSCKFNVTLGPATCVVVVFEDALGYSYLRVECPRPACQTEWALFVSALVADDNYKGTHQLIKNLVGVSGQRYELYDKPDADVYDNWAVVHDKDPVEAHELTDHEQSEVAFFLWEVEHGGLEKLV